MKCYKLSKDLPTFDEGDIFFIEKLMITMHKIRLLTLSTGNAMGC